MNLRFYALCLLVFAMCSGCTAQKPRLHEMATFASLEDFKLGPEGGVDLVWSTKRINDAATLKTTLQKYDSLVLGQTWIAVDKESAAALSDRQILGISQDMAEAIKTRLGAEFKLVEIPDENTLRLNIAMTNLETLAPILGVTNRFQTAGPGTSTVSKIIAGDQARVNRVTVELLVSDAKTNEALLAAIDKNFDNREISTTLDSVDNAKEPISLWADRLWTTLSYWNWIKKR